VHGRIYAPKRRDALTWPLLYISTKQIIPKYPFDWIIIALVNYPHSTERLRKHCRMISLKRCNISWWLQNVAESLLQNSNNVNVHFLLYLYCNKTFEQYCNVMYLDKFFTKTLKWKLFLYIHLINFNFSINRISTDMCFSKAIFLW